MLKNTTSRMPACTYVTRKMMLKMRTTVRTIKIVKIVTITQLRNTKNAVILITMNCI